MERPTTCHALLVDFDGVVRHWPADDLQIELEHGLEAGSIRQVAFEPGRLALALSGRLSDEGWRQAIAAGLRARYPDARADAAVAQWSGHAGSLDARVIDLLAAARRKVRLVLVTNATSRLPSDLQRLGLDGFFDVVVNSSAIGVTKPDRTMFDAALSLAGASAGQAFYVDDSPGNVDAARACGIDADVFNGVESLRDGLRARGLFAEAD